MKRILVPTDFNSLATAALEFAVPIARAAGAEITVLYADMFEPPVEFTALQVPSVLQALEASRANAAKELEQYAHEHVPAGVPVTTVVRATLPVQAVVEAAREADLIVMGTHGRGPISRILLGSVARAVVNQTETPVLTITRKAEVRPVKKILTAAAVEGRAREFATVFGASVEVVADEDLATREADLVVVPRGEGSGVMRHATAPVLTV